MCPRKSWKSLVWSLVWRYVPSKVLNKSWTSLVWRYVPSKVLKKCWKSLVWRYFPPEVLKTFGLKFSCKFVARIDHTETRLWTKAYLSKTAWPNLADREVHLDQVPSFANWDKNLGKYKEQQQKHDFDFFILPPRCRRHRCHKPGLARAFFPEMWISPASV